MKGDGGGWLGLLGVAAAAVLIVGGRRLFPALSTILLIGGGLFLLLILGIFVLALTVSRDSTKKTKGAPQSAEILAAARADLLQLRRTAMRVRAREISAPAGAIQSEAEKILRILKDRPDCIQPARRFWNYYLPTMRKILEKYVYLEENGQADESTVRSTAACLGEIRSAMERQREKLFAGDMLDLTAEMEVLRQMCQRDGLLTESDFSEVQEPPQTPAAQEAGESFTDGYSDDLEEESKNGQGTPMGQ